MKWFVVFLSLVLVACAPRTESLQTGDLIFCAVPLETDEGTAAGAIAASVGHGNVNIIHVAIVEVADDTVWVIDATMKRGVDRHPLDTLIRDFTGADGQKPILLVKRLKEGFSPQFIDNAKRFLGQPYDYWFQPDNGRQYCSELVWESYRRPDGTPLFDSYPMNFKGPEGTYPAYWVQLFKELGEPIPQDAPGTNPQDMAEADILRDVRLPVTVQDSAQEDEAILREWIKTISSDAFGGRKPMTPYEDITVDYLERQLAGQGLQPAFGGSWVQPFRMVAVTCRPVGGKIVAEGPRTVGLGYPDDLIVWTARAGEKVVIPEAEYVFCGFGIQAPEYGWNDYEGVDVRGKIVIAMVNDPAPLTRDVVILGGGESALDDYYVAAASAQGREIFFDDDNSDGWFFRSDHYNFVKKGVPAVVVENGLHPLDPRDAGKYPMESWYHKPCDEYRDDWDLTGTLANINLMYDVGLSLANTDARP